MAALYYAKPARFNGKQTLTHMISWSFSGTSGADPHLNRLCLLLNFRMLITSGVFRTQSSIYDNLANIYLFKAKKRST